MVGVVTVVEESCKAIGLELRLRVQQSGDRQLINHEVYLLVMKLER